MINVSLNSSFVRSAPKFIARRCSIIEKSFSSFSNKQKLYNSNKFEEVKHIIESPKDHIEPSAHLFYDSVNTLQSNMLIPHLKRKTNFYKNQKIDEEFWVNEDRKLLLQCVQSIKNDPAFASVKTFFSELIEGLNIHVKHRLDIIRLNKDKINPENGPLNREMYLLAEESSVEAQLRLLNQLGCEEDLITKALVASDFRRVIRNLLRIGGSQNNATVSAATSLKSSFNDFPSKYESIKVKLAIHPILNPFDLPLKFTEDRNVLDAEIQKWLHQHYLGLDFHDLVEKNMTKSPKSCSEALERIYITSMTANAGVNKAIKSKEPTLMTLQHKNDMMKTRMFSPAFSRPIVLGYKIVE